jgi:hypothetical protein
MLDDKVIRVMRSIVREMDGLTQDEINRLLRALSQMFDYKVPK